MSRWRGTACLLLMILLGSTAVSCGDDEHGAGGSLGADGASPEQVDTYGYGPPSDRSIKYQSDVVIVRGGAAAIRSASADGLTWTFDAKAPGASDIRDGKVVYVTSRAVGRVVDLRRKGGDVTVMLAPVSLTEIYRDAHFTIDRDIDPSELFTQQIPELPGALSTPSETDVPELPKVPGGPPGNLRSTTDPAVTQNFAPSVAGAGTALGGGASPDEADMVLTLPPVRFAPSLTGSGLPPAKKGSASVSLGGWSAEPYKQPGKFGLKIGYNSDVGLKVNANFYLRTDRLHIKSDVRIVDGIFFSNPTMTVTGIKGLGVSIDGGAANGADDNKKVRIEVPVELSTPIPGTPMVYTTSWKFIVATALGGKNTTVTANGEWSLGGAIGTVAGELQKPKFGVVKSIMDSISGISIGVSGVVLAIEAKFQLGLGIPGASAGPYLKIVFSLGVTNGSAFGAPLARCVSASLDGRIAVGFGLSLSVTAMDVISKILPKKAKITLDVESGTPIFSRKQTLPDVPLCVG